MASALSNIHKQPNIQESLVDNSVRGMMLKYGPIGRPSHSVAVYTLELSL